MTKNKFRNILKERIKENALKYLISKRGSKGKEIPYANIEMSEYLLPTNRNLSIEDKRKMFAIKNRMVKIPSNFPKPNIEYFCVCGRTENKIHIYNCEILSREKPKLSFENIFTGNIREQIEVMRRFEDNLQMRDEIIVEKESKSPCDPSVIRCLVSNG